MAEPLREHLIASDDHFRQLAQEHANHSERLETLLHKPHLSDEEQLEEIRLKKIKLRLKDEMEAIERTHRSPLHAA